MAEQPLNSMADPQLILKNAKASLVSLKEALSTKDAWDRDVEFHRRDARRQFLHLIFDFPYSPQTLSLDNPIWLETSHACIQAFRQRLATLDKAIAEKAAKTSNNASGSHNEDNAVNVTTTHRGRRSETGPVVEHRKVLQRFRQFLSEEEKFFTAYILRFVRSFALDEAIPRLEALQLNRTNNDDPSLRKATFPEEQPPQEPPPNQREKKILTLVKALISLGDLARYKEQYNERQGRPKAGAEEALPRWATKANRKAGENVPRPRNYTRSLACYTQARLLFPDGGQAFHQMAILSSYQSDSFAGVLYYYRSLCVRVPFNMAFDNLVRTLDKIYAAWKHEGGVKTIGVDSVKEGEDPLKAGVDRFKKDVVVLHALWRTERSTEAELDAQNKHTLIRFNKLLAERQLPIGLIIKIYTAAVGALWSFQKHLKRASKAANPPAVGKEGNPQREGVVLTHVMDLHLGLVNLAITQLNPEATSSGATPAEKITAVLRRILQTLRVASRWVIANLEYLYQSTNPAGDSDSTNIPSPGLSRTLGEFWSSYAVFITALEKTFPERDLQVGKVSVEEDVELAAFTPLKGSLKPSKDAIPLNQVHPNDEYLFRIRDLLDDAAILVKSEMTPLTKRDGVYISSTEVFTPIAALSLEDHIKGSNDGQPPHPAIFDYPKIPNMNQPGPSTSRLMGPTNGTHVEPSVKATAVEDKLMTTAGEEDDVASVSTDDPVTMAMRATLNVSDEEDGFGEEDEILYPHQRGTWSTMEPLYDTVAAPLVSRPPIPPAAFRQVPTTFHDSSALFPHMSPNQDVFGPVSASSAFGPGPAHFPQQFYQEQTPTRYYNEHSFQRLGAGAPTGSPIRSNHHQAFSTSTMGPYAGHIGSPSSIPINMNTIGVPTTPRRPFSGSFSGGSTGGFSGDTSSHTPPRTAQDLLMRMLGGGGGGAAQPSPQSHPLNTDALSTTTYPTATRPRHSQSPPRAQEPIPENRPALFFGASGGHSIWAP